METKNCPCCGEIIQAGALKCHHCGEWLETPAASDSSTAPEPETAAAPEPASDAAFVTETEQEPDLITDFVFSTTGIKWACRIAIFFEIVSFLQGNPDVGLGRWRFIKWVLSPFVEHMPDWLVVVVLGTLWVIVLMGLRHFLQERRSVNTPMIALMCLTVGLSLMGLIACFVESEEAAGTLLVFGLLLMVATCVMWLIAGIKFCGSKLTRKLGMASILYAVVPLVVLIIELGLDSETQVFMSFADTVFAIYLLYEVKELLSD